MKQITPVMRKTRPCTPPRGINRTATPVVTNPNENCKVMTRIPVVI